MSWEEVVEVAASTLANAFGLQSRLVFRMLAYETPGGHPVPTITADEMRQVDRVAVDEVGLRLVQILENAGRGVADLVNDAKLTGGPIVVLAGPGANGGGGLCAARHLANRGRSVAVLLDRPSETLRGHTREQFHVLDEMADGHRPAVETTVPDIEIALDDASLVVDALVGNGFFRPPRGRTADLIESTTDHARRVLSLGVPSGVDPTSGETPGVAVTPDQTLALGIPTSGVGDAPGELFLADVGIPTVVFDRVGIEYDSPFDDGYRTPVRLVER